MERTVKITCSAEKTLPLTYLNPMQGSLKSISKKNLVKLKNSILENGFSFPFFVWNNDGDAQIYIIDGHQRKIALESLRDDGYSIPQLPVHFIEADSMSEAKKKLLAAASQYGEPDKAGVAAFVADMDLELAMEFAALPSIDLNLFKAVEAPTTHVNGHERSLAVAPLDDKPKEPKFDHTCPRCAHEFNDEDEPKVPKTITRKKKKA